MRRVLLKNTQDETGGHVRLESGAGGCNVEAQASAAPAGAHLLLLRRDGTVRDAGTLNAGRLQILLRGEDVATLTGATVALGGRALLFGGEGISAEAARRAAAQSAQAPNGETRLASREASAHAPAQEAAGPAAQQVPASAHVPAQEAVGPAAQQVPASAHAPAQEAAGPAAQQAPASAHAPAQEAAGPAAQQAPASAHVPAQEAVGAAAQQVPASANIPAQEAVGAAAQQVPASAHVPAQEAAGPAEDGNGWMFRSAGDGQRFDGMLYAGGKPVLQAEGYLSPYSPQPPPGLPGARWQDGFFIDFQKIDG